MGFTLRLGAHRDDRGRRSAPLWIQRRGESNFAGMAIAGAGAVPAERDHRGEIRRRAAHVAGERRNPLRVFLQRSRLRMDQRRVHQAAGSNAAGGTKAVAGELKRTLSNCTDSLTVVVR